MILLLSPRLFSHQKEPPTAHSSGMCRGFNFWGVQYYNHRNPTGQEEYNKKRGADQSPPIPIWQIRPETRQTAVASRTASLWRLGNVPVLGCWARRPNSNAPFFWGGPSLLVGCISGAGLTLRSAWFVGGLYLLLSFFILACVSLCLLPPPRTAAQGYEPERSSLHVSGPSKRQPSPRLIFQQHARSRQADRLPTPGVSENDTQGHQRLMCSIVI